jgi:8-oxo-dGTP diphosphatase
MQVRHSLSVACAVIQHGQYVLAVQRGPTMSMPGKWEFPGGKIEEGESVISCIHRELWEELRIRIVPKETLPPTRHESPVSTIVLHPVRAEIRSATVILMEHSAARWITISCLSTLDWSVADLPIVAYLQQAS